MYPIYATSSVANDNNIVNGVVSIVEGNQYVVKVHMQQPASLWTLHNTNKLPKTVVM